MAVLGIGSIRAQDEVVRVNTNLVQTDLMVFDKQGKFVPDIRPDQFTVTVDGQPQSLAFFEQVSAGSTREQQGLAAIRSAGKPAGTTSPDTGSGAVSRGRIVIFFVDDLHLSADGLSRSRKALQQFIDSEMTDDDLVAIASSSGQIGFLQQLTDNQTVLRTAVARLGYRKNGEAYAGKTRISEFAAAQIADHNDNRLYAYLLDSIKNEQQMGPGNRNGDHGTPAAYSAKPMLDNRISQINNDSRRQAGYTLDALQALVRSSAALPGRKLLFFLSDGFPFDVRDTRNHDHLDRITAAATASGAVFYSVDMRGAYLDSGVSASSNDMADGSSRLAGLQTIETQSTRELMNQLAEGTGGRLIANSNKVGDDIRRAVAETGEYYLLAWTLSPEQITDSRLRVKVTIKDRPDLRVRMRSQSVVAAASTPTVNSPLKDAKAKAVAADPNVQLLSALGSVYPKREIPVLMSVGYVGGAGAELSLRISMQIDRGSLLAHPEAAGPEPAKLDVVGAALDDRGVIVTFKQTVTVGVTDTAHSDPVVWHQQLKVPPGLYQVRVAVRESATGRTGSANQWIEAPAPADGKLAVSSIFLAERQPENVTVTTEQKGPSPVTVDVDHKFNRASVLRFQTYVYNAMRTGTDQPEVTLGAQILHNGQPVMSLSPNLLPILGGTTAATLPYWAEFALDQLRAGRYVLQINATDRRTNTTAAQRIKFTVE
ncbi:MAG: VWA domain-containing protein [Pyrinomonadaceae bacterium]